MSTFQILLYPENDDPLDAIPHIPLGGWGNWRHAIGATIGLKNAGDKAIKTYCILDSDYKTDKEIAEIREQARRYGLQLHIWNKKEIENYFLIPTAIYRLISQKSRIRSPRLETVVNRLERICEEQKNYTTDAIATEILSKDKSYSLANANRAARETVRDAWLTIDGKLALVSGKRVLSEVSSWSQKNYGVSINPLAIARTIRAEELDREIVDVINCISQIKDFQVG